MAETPLIVVLLSVMYLLAYLFVAIYLFIRARKTKLYNLIYMGLTFFIMALDVVFLQFLPDTVITYLNTNLYHFTLLLFVQTTFYSGKKSPIKILLLINLLSKIFGFLMGILFHYSSLTAFPIPANELFLFYVTVFNGSLTFFIAGGWLSYISLKTYKEVKSKENIEPWIKKRYLMLFIGVTPYLLQGFLIFFIPSDGLIFASPQGFGVGLVLMLLNLWYAYVYLFAWIMPKWLKKILNQGYTPAVQHAETEDEELSDEELERMFMEGAEK